MENIYNQTPFAQNSIVDLPDGFVKDAGNTLYSWLGSLWRSIHKGDALVRGLQTARGMRLAQLYLDLLEAAKLQDRFGMPVFHRELWHPIVIRSSERDSAQENMLSIGLDARIGEQPPGSIYGEGTVLSMGKLANFKDYVTYPVPGDIVGMATSIVDNIVNPAIIMEYGDNKDFTFRNNTIIFHRKNDPLATGSLFEKYDVPGMDDDHSHIETVLWASNVLIDRDYLANHLSYVLGADAQSTDVVKRILNAAWSSVSSGLTPELLKTFLAAMMNIPVIQSERETVVNIKATNEAQMVYTDSGVYSVSPKAKLIQGLHIGSVLHKGDLLDESLRIYPYLNILPAQDSGPSSSSASSGSAGDDAILPEMYSVPLEQDIPSVTVPPALLRPRTKYGIYATWNKVVVKQSKTLPFDANKNPHLYFDLGGTPQDVDAFWQDVWSNAERQKIHMADLIGEAGSFISPAMFFLKHFVGANTLFVVIDESQLDDQSLVRNPMFFGMLNSVVPSAIRLFLVEHRPVDGDEMSLDDSQERTFVAAALPVVEEHVRANPPPGLSDDAATFGDRINMRFIRPSPVKIMRRKEEDEGV